MFNLSKLTNFLKNFRQQRKDLKKRIKPARSLARFKKKYSQYKIDTNCYCLSLIKQSHKDTTLKIGSYCLFASNIQIFLGGGYRADWVTTYPFPAFHLLAKHIQNHSTSKGNVTTGNDVWLCANYVILSSLR